MNAFFIYMSCFGFACLLVFLLYKNKVVFTVGQREFSSDKFIYNVIALCIALLPVLFIIGNRYFVGTDYKNYLTMYNDYISWGYYTNLEIGIVWLFNLSNVLNIGFKGFLWFAAFLSVFLSAVVLCRNYNKTESIIAVLFYLCLYFGPACNIIAQTISLSFIILAYEKIIDKKLFQFLLLVAGATLFHTASLIIIPIYWFYNSKNKKRYWYVLAILVAVVFIFIAFPNVMSSLLVSVNLGRYAAYLHSNRIFTFVYLFIYRLPLYSLEFINVKKMEDRRFRLYYLLLVFEITGIILGVFITWVGRIVYFFSIAHVIIDLEIINLQHRKKNKMRYIAIFVVYYIIAFYFMHFFSDFDGINVFQLATNS